MSRIAVLTFTWWILTNGAYDSWQIGGPAIVAAVYLDYRLFRPQPNRWSLGGVIAFALFFLRLSVTSGIDVAWRAYHPQIPLNPAVIVYPLRLTSAAARHLFVCTISLLPGTLSIELSEYNVMVHVLDVDRPFRQELSRIEDRVDAVFRHAGQLDGHRLKKD